MTTSLIGYPIGYFFLAYGAVSTPGWIEQRSIAQYLPNGSFVLSGTLYENVSKCEYPEGVRLPIELTGPPANAFVAPEVSTAIGVTGCYITLLSILATDQRFMRTYVFFAGVVGAGLAGVNYFLVFVRGVSTGEWFMPFPHSESEPLVSFEMWYNVWQTAGFWGTSMCSVYLLRLSQRVGQNGEDAIAPAEYLVMIWRVIRVCLLLNSTADAIKAALDASVCRAYREHTIFYSRFREHMRA